MKAKIKTWNDLPEFSTWPARFLSGEEVQRSKDRKQLEREYEKEKWGPLLDGLGKNGFQLRQADRCALAGCDPQPCWVNGELKVLPALKALLVYRQLVQQKLLPHLHNATALVELGAGYGAIILWLAKQPAFKNLPCFAGEFAKSGRELIQKISVSEKLSVTSGTCDFFDPNITDLKIPPGALIFTSMSCCCLPKLPSTLFRKLSGFKPSSVVHLEPIVEHFDPSSLMGLLQQQYIAENDYNRNFLALLRAGEKSGLLKVVKNSPMVFGMNPLLPCSLLAWKPLKKGSC